MAFRIVVSLAPAELDTLPRRARAVESAGLDGLGFGDSPGFAEPYLASAVAAQAIESLAVGPFVTNLVTRSPVVAAHALRTLEALTPGPVFAGIGAGDSALAAAGRGPLNPDEFSRRLAVLRREWAADDLSRPAGRAILVAANGPRMIAAGCAVADTVVTGTGLDPATLARSSDLVRRGAAAAGRVGAVSHWCMARVAIRDDVASATRELLPLLASGANHVFAVAAERNALAPDVRAAITALREGYDYRHHGSAEANPNAAAVDRLGLRTMLATRFAAAGPPDVVVAVLTRLAESGIDGVVIPAVGLDIDTLIDRLGTEVLPELRRRLAASAMDPLAAQSAPAASAASSVART